MQWSKILLKSTILQYLKWPPSITYIPIYNTECIFDGSRPANLPYNPYAIMYCLADIKISIITATIASTNGATNLIRLTLRAHTQ